MSLLKSLLFISTYFVLVTTNPLVQYPELRYLITKTWDNHSTSDGAEIHVSFKAVEEFGPYGRGMVIKFEAPYYNDPLIADTVPTDKPFLGLWNYEVVEAFFLGNDEEYLEIELGPKGHYVLLLLKGPNNLITYQLPLQVYKTECSSVSGRWVGMAYIPGEYFPCNITKFNAFSIHNSKPNQVHMALFPVPQDQYEVPDFHRLDAFQPIDLGVELNPKCLQGSGANSHPHHEISGALPVEQIPQIVDS